MFIKNKNHAISDMSQSTSAHKQAKLIFVFMNALKYVVNLRFKDNILSKTTVLK